MRSTITLKHTRKVEGKKIVTERKVDVETRSFTNLPEMVQNAGNESALCQSVSEFLHARAIGKVRSKFNAAEIPSQENADKFAAEAVAVTLQPRTIDPEVLKAAATYRKLQELLRAGNTEAVLALLAENN